MGNPEKGPWNIFRRGTEAPAKPTHVEGTGHALESAEARPFDTFMPNEEELEQIRQKRAERLQREAAEEAKKQEALRSGKTIDGKIIQPHTGKELEARAQWLGAETRAIEARGAPHEILFARFPVPQGASDSFIRQDRTQSYDWEEYLPVDIRSIVDYVQSSEKKRFKVRLDREFSNGDGNDRRWSGVKAYLTW